MLTDIRKISFDGIEYYCGGFTDFSDFILKKLNEKLTDKIIIVHINLRNYYYLQKDRKLKEGIKNHCMTIFEGIGMKIGFFLRGYGILPDLNGTDLIPLLMEKIHGNPNFFLLGSEKQTVEKAVKILEIRFPNINICGCNSGYFSENEETNLVEKINYSKADILLVGMGFPSQEKFILKYKNNIRVSLIWNVGGLFDVLSGEKKRAPYIFRKLRLEWFYRFLLEPGRMLHRNTVSAFWSLNHIIFKNRWKFY